MKKVLLFALFILILGSSAYAEIDYNNTNLRHKIAQMLIVGFDGTKLDEQSPLYDDLINDRISGVIIFSQGAANGSKFKNVQDPKQLKKLICDINKASKTKLFITIDEEGGKITRLPSSRGFKVKTLSHMELGNKNDEMTT